jgi:hypothetical protein
MTDQGSPIFPTAQDDDDDDVAWALSTAHVQWKRGSQADAVVWLRRAIDSALAVDATWRAAELTRQTDQLEAFILRGPSAEPPASDAREVDDLLGTGSIAPSASSQVPEPQSEDSGDIAEEDFLPEADELGDDAYQDDDEDVQAAEDPLTARPDPLGQAQDIPSAPRFSGGTPFPESEAPTVSFTVPAPPLPYESESEPAQRRPTPLPYEIEPELDAADHEPATVSQPEPRLAEVEEDPNPTPVKQAAAQRWQHQRCWPRARPRER